MPLLLSLLYVQLGQLALRLYLFLNLSSINLKGNRFQTTFFFPNVGNNAYSVKLNPSGQKKYHSLLSPCPVSSSLQQIAPTGFFLLLFLYGFYAKALITHRQAEGNKYRGSRKLREGIRLFGQWPNPALPKLEENKYHLCVFTLLCLSTREML